MHIFSNLAEENKHGSSKHVKNSVDESCVQINSTLRESDSVFTVSHSCQVYLSNYI